MFNVKNCSSITLSWFCLLAFALSSNLAFGKSLGINLTNISDFSGQYPFIDLMKQAREWRDPATKDHEFFLDERGWVTKLKPGQVAATVFLSVPNKDLVMYRRAWVLYDGKGEINYQWKARLIPEQSSPGRDFIKMSHGNHRLVIKSSDPNDPIRNIRIIPEVHYPLYEQGEIFNPDWLKIMTPMFAIRFMDWMQTNDSDQQYWEDRPQVGDRSWALKGVPAEVIIALSNKLNIHPWINIPHKANQKYIDSLAHLFAKGLHKALHVYVEHSNEIWNWQFKQAGWADKKGQADIGKDGYARMQWHGFRTVKACKAFRSAMTNLGFNTNSARVSCVLGVQKNWHGLEKHALDCPHYKKTLGTSCANGGIDYIGITGYFGGGLNGPKRKDENRKAMTEDLLSLVRKSQEDDFTSAFRQLEQGGELKYYTSKGIFSGLRRGFTYWNSVSDKYGLPLVAYEGGQHITANAKPMQENKELIDFHIQLNRHPKMGTLYTKYLNEWKEHGGGLFMHFTDVSMPDKWGSWGALESIKQDSSPKWDAIKGFSLNTPCWWENCRAENK